MTRPSISTRGALAALLVAAALIGCERESIARSSSDTAAQTPASQKASVGASKAAGGLVGARVAPFGPAVQSVTPAVDPARLAGPIEPTRAAAASGTSRRISTASRGPQLEIGAARGLDTSKARVTARHSRASALDYCRFVFDYGWPGDPVPPARMDRCVQDELAKPPLTATADCTDRTFTSLLGDTYRHAGRGLGSTGGLYDRWVDVRSGEERGSSSADDYLALQDQYRTLCPRTHDLTSDG